MESEDYTGRELIPVGDYANPSRVIRGRQKDDGEISFEITVMGLEREGQTFARGGLRTWVSTKRYSRPNVSGQTSGAAEYLRAVGFDPKGKSTEEIVALMNESQNIPVGVFVGRTNKTSKLEDGTYEKEVLKTKDFNVGTKDQPQYVAEVVVNGQKFEARHKIGGFKRLS